MTKKIQLLPSGIPLVDLAWGGLYKGGTYFLIGPRKSGRTLLAIQYAFECAQQKEVCLFFTTMRPKDLMIHAASIDIDLQHYMNKNLIIVVRVTPPANIDEMENPDEYLAEYLKDIVSVVEQYNPNKIVFDELTPLIGFSDIPFLKETFAETTEKIEDTGITSLYVLSEPATPASQAIVDALTESATGVIFLQKHADVVSRLQPGTMTITPNIGHTEGKFTAPYFVEPYKGIQVDFKPVTKTGLEPQPVSPADQKYKPLTEIELPSDAYAFTNIYSLDDFRLILNNQIAMYQITGQTFTLVSIRLDELAEKKNLITLNQLKNAIRLAADKKDKICSVENKVLVLMARDDKNAVNKLIAKMKINLPNDDPEYIQTVSEYISVYPVTVSKEIHNAEEMLAQVLAENPAAKDKHSQT